MLFETIQVDKKYMVTVENDFDIKAWTLVTDFIRDLQTLNVTERKTLTKESRPHS